MTVYVHKLRGQGAALLGRTASPDPWFVLTADSEMSCMPLLRAAWG